MSAGLTESDLPGLYQDANRNSLKAQQKYLLFTKLGLIAAIVAAAAGATSVVVASADIGGIVATFAFVSAIVLRSLLLKETPEKIWYEGRAGAESAKTTAWRYAVGGDPFGKSLTDSETRKHLIERLREISEGLDPQSIVSSSGEPLPNITEGMTNLRQKPLQERIDAYREGRVKDQKDWYSRKAELSNRRAKQWNAILITIEIFGVLAGILKATNIIDIDLLGLTAALVAAGGSWLQTKQHSNLAEAYTVAARELSYIDSLLASCTKEQEWSNFVDEAEEAISREHTLWIASRSSSRRINALHKGYRRLQP